MNVRKKILLILTILLLGKPLLPSGQSAEYGKTITLSIWGIPEYDQYRGTHEAIKEFVRRHPNIRVHVGAPGGSADVDPQKLLTAVAAGSPPDLILQDRFTISGWSARGAFFPLNDLVARDGIRAEDFYPACWDEVIYRGKIYGIPWDTDARALYYNRSILKKYGYDRPPADWDELADWGVRMTIKKGVNLYEQVGFAPLFGNSWLFLFGWQNGGEFLSSDGLRCVMNSPQNAAALAWMKKTYDALGGYMNVRGFEYAAGFGGTIDPFITGKIAMVINGNWVLDDIARYNPDLDFGVILPPGPKGGKSLTWSGGFAMAIPAASKHVEEAWELAKWLTFEEGTIFQGEKQKEFNKTIGKKFYIPRLTCQRELNKKMFKRFPAPNENMQKVIESFIEMLYHSRFRPVTPVGQVLWNEQIVAADMALRGELSPRKALENSARRVQDELNRIYIPPVYPNLRWNRVVLIGAALLAGLLALWIRAIVRFTRNTRLYRKEAVVGILFIMPWLLGFLIFTLGPMFVSLVFSFCEYDVIHPAQFSGLNNYVQLFGFHRVPAVEGGMEWAPRDPYFWKSLWNTAYITALGVPLGMVIGLGIALLLNAEIRGISFYRTFFYIPSIVPAVATTILFFWMLNPQIGPVNFILRPIFDRFGLPTPQWFDSPMWSKPGLLLILLWGAGSSMVIWLAGLKGISRQYYEAAEMDGAGPIARFFYVTLPMLTPYIFFNLVIGVISYLQIFTQAYMVSQPPSAGPADSLLVLVFYLFNNAFAYFKMGYASALAWILFVIILILTLLQFHIARRWVHYEGGGGTAS